MVKYFKLINGKNFVGIASSLDFLALQQKHHLLLLSDVESGQYISINGVLYRDQWMKPVADDNIRYEIASVLEISEDEYIALRETIDAGEEIATEQDVVEVPDDNIPSDPNDEITIEFIRGKKLTALSKQCQDAIVHGVDVELSTGETKHYSLSVEDQLNIASMITLIQQGMPAVPYHADGELCEYYEAQDMQRIATAATSWKTYHITYFNSLKNYINSLDDVAAVADIQYGMMPPTDFCSDVLLEMINNA